MPYDFTKDLDFILGDFDGVDVTKGGTTVKGKKDEQDAIAQDGSGQEVVIRQTSVVIRTGALALADDDQITVDGVAARVRGVPLLLDDGKMTRVIYART